MDTSKNDRAPKDTKRVGAQLHGENSIETGQTRREKVDNDHQKTVQGAASGLAAVDTIFSVKGRISPIYLADATVEAALIAAWLSRTGVFKETRGC